MTTWSPKTGARIRLGAVLALSGLIGGCLMSTAANASTITETYNVSLGGFVDISSGVTPPFAALDASFTITLDPTQHYTSDTTDITVNYFHGPTVDSPIGFTYYATGSAFPGWLFVGGTANDSDYTAAGTNDFAVGLDIIDPGSPQLLTCGDPRISCGSATGNGAYLASAYTTKANSNSFWLASTAASQVSVPEPDSLPLFALGLGVLGVVAWRREHRRTAA